MNEVPDGVSTEHSCSDHVFLRPLLFTGHGGQSMRHRHWCVEGTEWTSPSGVHEEVQQPLWRPPPTPYRTASGSVRMHPGMMSRCLSAVRWRTCSSRRVRALFGGGGGGRAECRPAAPLAPFGCAVPFAEVISLTQTSSPDGHLFIDIKTRQKYQLLISTQLEDKYHRCAPPRARGSPAPSSALPRHVTSVRQGNSDLVRIRNLPCAKWHSVRPAPITS